MIWLYYDEDDNIMEVGNTVNADASSFAILKDPSL